MNVESFQMVGIQTLHLEGALKNTEYNLLELTCAGGKKPGKYNMTITS